MTDGISLVWLVVDLRFVGDDHHRLRVRIVSTSVESMCDGSTGAAIFYVLRAVKRYGLHSSNCVSSIIALQRAWCE